MLPKRSDLQAVGTGELQMAAVKTPAERLMGLELVDGWKVIEEVAKPPGFTGGNFSCGYIVRGEDGRKAYVKALDLTPPFGQQGDWTLILRGLLDGYEHERQLCRQCRKMSRVVNVLADGDIMVDPNDPLTRVPYLVFELADSDVRSEFEALKNAAKTFEIAWALRSLHHVATGLWQLHQRQIVHQDLKPSNILVFDQEGSKVTDLGRSAAKAMRSPNDDEDVPCDRTYAPPELAFGWVAPEDDNWGRLGLAATRRAAYYLEKFIKKRTGGKTKTRDKVSGLMRYGLIKNSVADRVLLVGDAACHLKPFSGGGLLYGLIGTHIASKACENSLKQEKYDYGFLKKNYDYKWREKLRYPMLKGLWMNKIAYNSPDWLLDFGFGVGRYFESVIGELVDEDLL